jgi:hypothetical protein
MQEFAAGISFLNDSCLNVAVVHALVATAAA